MAQTNRRRSRDRRFSLAQTEIKETERTSKKYLHLNKFRLFYSVDLIETLPNFGVFVSRDIFVQLRPQELVRGIK